MLSGKVFLAAAALAFGSHCYASTIILSSQSSGAYDYEVQLPPFDGVSFADNDTIVFSGLSGVTGASVLDEVPANLYACFTATFTSTSATFTANGGAAACGFSGGENSIDFGTFQITSGVTTPGTIDYTSDPSSGTLAGTVQGPVSSVPEPASWTTALLPLLWISRHLYRTSKG